MEQLRVKGNLTPGFMNNKLSRFLDALSGIQHTIDEIKQRPPSAVKIHKIAWESDSYDQETEVEPLEINSLKPSEKALSDLREALDTFWQSYAEHMQEPYDSGGRHGSFDTLGDFMLSEDKKQEINQFIDLLKGEEND